jgi:hypothetical protein
VGIYGPTVKPKNLEGMGYEAIRLGCKYFVDDAWLAIKGRHGFRLALISRAKLCLAELSDAASQHQKTAKTDSVDLIRFLRKGRGYD